MIRTVRRTYDFWLGNFQQNILVSFYQNDEIVESTIRVTLMRNLEIILEFCVYFLKGNRAPNSQHVHLQELIYDNAHQ